MVAEVTVLPVPGGPKTKFLNFGRRKITIWGIFFTKHHEIRCDFGNTCLWEHMSLKYDRPQEAFPVPDLNSP